MDPTLTPKPWWQSRTIIGALMVLVAQALHAAHIEVGSEQLTDAAMEGITFFGTLMAIYGRVKASRPISFTSKPTMEAPSAAGVSGPSSVPQKPAGFTKGSGGTAGFCRPVALAAVAVVLCGGTFVVALADNPVSITPGRRDVVTWLTPTDVIVWSTPVDERPFWVRLLTSLRIVPCTDDGLIGAYVKHSADREDAVYFGTSRPMLVGGADF